MNNMNDRVMPATSCTERVTRKLLAALVSWALVAGTCLAVLPVHAQDVNRATTKAVRAAVQGQLDAFAAGDEIKAFSFASPDIRKQFGNAATFMSMVRQAYPMVVRPAAVSYFRPESRDGALWQVVLLRDQSGQLWRAVYELRLQSDKRWRINGCTVTRDDERSTT